MLKIRRELDGYAMILAITPARGGSRGIPRKNITEICGKPLIAWTIEAAKKSKLIDRYVVSTEDREIARIAKEYGAEVLDRPKALARDKATTLSVLQHALKKIDADVVVLLQATSPIRNPGLIDTCIRQFIKKKADSLATGFVCKYEEYGKCHRRRQDIKGFFYDDGNVYVMKADILRKGDRYGKRIEQVLTDREQNVEIDDEFDFWLAGQVLKKRITTKNKSGL
jgi:CMP-N-acetylneuraminic acid synthetase